MWFRFFTLVETADPMKTKIQVASANDATAYSDCSDKSIASQHSFHNETIFRLLLKVAVEGVR